MVGAVRVVGEGYKSRSRLKLGEDPHQLAMTQLFSDEE